MGMIINPYRFGGTVWTPPNAVLWYYGSLLSGSQWADRIGSNHGTFQGGASAASDGVACSDTKYVTAASAGINTLVVGLETISAALWLKLTDNEQSNVPIIAKDRFYTLNYWMIIGYRAVGTTSRFNFSIEQYYTNSFNQAISENWMHVAITYNKNTGSAKFYFNNGSPVSGSMSGTPLVIPTNSADLIIGKSADYVDDVIISNSEWSTSDVADIYNNSPATHK